MKNYLILIITFISIKAFTQQDPLLTHTIFNPYVYNPAFTGNNGGLMISAMHRSQWVGIVGAPSTQFINVQSTFFGDNNAIGLSITNDVAGPLVITNFYTDYAYTIDFDDNIYITLGFKAGASIYKADIDNLLLDDANDNAFITDLKSKALPNIGTGGVINYNDFYFGFSVPKFLKNDYIQNSTDVIPLDGNKNGGSDENLHYYVMSGTTISLSRDLDFLPHVLLRITDGAPISTEIYGIMEYKEQIYGGLMFRKGDAFGALLGLNLTGQIIFGYSFDFSYGLTTTKYNSGSHELFIQYSINKKKKQFIKSPRYF